MPKDGIHATFSTNWKFAVELSKPVHRKIEATKVASDAHSAVALAFRATVSSSPRIRRIAIAPTVGRNVTREWESRSSRPSLPAA